MTLPIFCPYPVGNKFFVETTIPYDTLEQAIKAAKIFNEQCNITKQLKQKLEKIEKYKEAIHEAKNKAKSPLEHHALESAEHTIKEILKDES